MNKINGYEFQVCFSLHRNFNASNYPINNYLKKRDLHYFYFLDKANKKEIELRKKPDQVEIKNERVDDQYKMESYLESVQLNEENEARNNEGRDLDSTQIIVTRRRRKRTNPAQYKEIEIRRSRSKLRSRSAPNYRVSDEDKEDASTAKQARRSYFLRENRRLDSYKETLDEEDPNFDRFRDPSTSDEEFDEKSAGFAYGNSFQQFAPSETNMSEANAYAGNDPSDEYENEEENEEETKRALKKEEKRNRQLEEEKNK